MKKATVYIICGESALEEINSLMKTFDALTEKEIYEFLDTVKTIAEKRLKLAKFVHQSDNVSVCVRIDCPLAVKEKAEEIQLRCKNERSDMFLAMEYVMRIPTSDFK